MYFIKLRKVKINTIHPYISWVADACSTVGVIDTVTNFGLEDADEVAPVDDDSGTSCSCNVNTDITVVADITGMFANSNIDALCI